MPTPIPTPTPLPTPTPIGAPSRSVVTISIQGMAGSLSFSPSPANVSVGQQVRWRNADTVEHTATDEGGAFDTGPIAPGATSAPVTLGSAGTVSYRCTFHPTMVGRLNVTP